MHPLSASLMLILQDDTRHGFPFSGGSIPHLPEKYQPYHKYKPKVMDNKNKVLVIENSRKVLDTISETLDYFGFPHRGLKGLDEVSLNELENEQIGLVILDILNPKKNGGAHIRRLRAHPVTRNAPIIVISTYPKLDETEIAEKADDTLLKPFSIDELRHKVEKYL